MGEVKQTAKTQAQNPTRLPGRTSSPHANKMWRTHVGNTTWNTTWSKVPISPSFFLSTRTERASTDTRRECPRRNNRAVEMLRNRNLFCSTLAKIEGRKESEHLKYIPLLDRFNQSKHGCVLEPGKNQMHNSSDQVDKMISWVKLRKILPHARKDSTPYKIKQEETK